MEGGQNPPWDRLDLFRTMTATTQKNLGGEGDDRL